MKLQQPWLAIVMTLVTVVISFGIISLVDEHTFHGWLSYAFLAMIPAQIYLAVCLKCQHPAVILRLPQPWRGLAFTALVTGVAAIVIPAGLYTVNEGRTDPGTVLIFYCIFSVVVILWMGEIFHSWPFNVFLNNPMAVAACVLAGAYTIAWLLFSLLFDFSHMAALPNYVEALDPHGLYSAPTVMAYAVSSAASILVSVHLFESWPVKVLVDAKTSSVHAVAAVLLQALVTILIALFACYLGMSLLGMDSTTYLARVPVSFIFGYFIVMNMSQRRLFLGQAQPIKGLFLVCAAMMTGVVMYEVYSFFAPWVQGSALASGFPSYQSERWVAAALLSVTFPFVVVLTGFLIFIHLLKKSTNPVKHISA